MSRPPLVCADRSGFLFAHACDRPAAGVCTVCGKPICAQHTRVGATGPTCIGCLRGGAGDELRDRDHSSTRASDASDDREAVTREAPEGRFGGGGAGGQWPEAGSAARADDPYFFPGVDRAAYYDADDHAAFDVPAEPDAAGAAGDTDTGAS